MNEHDYLTHRISTILNCSLNERLSNEHVQSNIIHDAYKMATDFFKMICSASCDKSNDNLKIVFELGYLPKEMICETFITLSSEIMKGTTYLSEAGGSTELINGHTVVFDKRNALHSQDFERFQILFEWMESSLIAFYDQVDANNNQYLQHIILATFLTGYHYEKLLSDAIFHYTSDRILSHAFVEQHRKVHQSLNYWSNFLPLIHSVLNKSVSPDSKEGSMAAINGAIEINNERNKFKSQLLNNVTQSIGVGTNLENDVEMRRLGCELIAGLLNDCKEEYSIEDLKEVSRYFSKSTDQALLTVENHRIIELFLKQFRYFVQNKRYDKKILFSLNALIKWVSRDSSFLASYMCDKLKTCQTLYSDLYKAKGQLDQTEITSRFAKIATSSLDNPVKPMSTILSTLCHRIVIDTVKNWTAISKESLTHFFTSLEYATQGEYDQRMSQLLAEGFLTSENEKVIACTVLKTALEALVLSSNRNLSSSNYDFYQRLLATADIGYQSLKHIKKDTDNGKQALVDILAAFSMTNLHILKILATNVNSLDEKESNKFFDLYSKVKSAQDSILSDILLMRKNQHKSAYYLQITQLHCLAVPIYEAMIHIHRGEIEIAENHLKNNKLLTHNFRDSLPKELRSILDPLISLKESVLHQCTSANNVKGKQPECDEAEPLEASILAPIPPEPELTQPDLPQNDDIHTPMSNDALSKKRIDDLQRKIDNQRSEIKSLIAKIQERDKTIYDFSKAESGYQKESNKVKTVVSQQLEQIQRLKEQVKRLKLELKDYMESSQTQASNHEMEVTEYKTKIDNLRDEHSFLIQKNSVKESEILALTEQMAGLKIELGEKTAELEGWKQTASASTFYLEEFRKVNAAMTSEHQRSLGEIALLLSELDALRRQAQKDQEVALFQLDQARVNPNFRREDPAILSSISAMKDGSLGNYIGGLSILRPDHQDIERHLNYLFCSQYFTSMFPFVENSNQFPCDSYWLRFVVPKISELITHGGCRFDKYHTFSYILLLLLLRESQLQSNQVQHLDALCDRVMQHLPNHDEGDSHLLKTRMAKYFPTIVSEYNASISQRRDPLVFSHQVASTSSQPQNNDGVGKQLRP